MPPRKKSRFEHWFSFSRHQRRKGAAALQQTLSDVDIHHLKTALIQGDMPTYTYGSAKDLTEHIDNLRQEFVGQSELNHYHASLIVFIRRDVDVARNYQLFKSLWLTERDFLLASLNTRWLISACDTFIDFDDDPVLSSLLMNAVVLINTLKVTETENLLCNHEHVPNPAMLQKLQTERVALFDGTSALAVGTDDTLRNMRWRLDKVCQYHPLGGIVLEVFERLQTPLYDNAFSRLRLRHTRERTRWW